ncbi:hypothetical protein NE237_016583 [Protea cynaroides]|uniref:Thioredoxin domain-containing protein n=1 Tax=Protea cynaroides TaxID=273540 RepID=A0A9Q0HIS7_9MAGN|nr:hypothetical protein NE237_016583 [Protea cynaroides]
MAVVFGGPRSLSCSRFMAKHAFSSLPLQWNRTHLDCAATVYWKAQSGIKVQIPNYQSLDLKDCSRSMQATRDYGAPMITGDSWDEFILNNDTPILVEFFAPWCGPCRMVHRVIEEIAREYAGTLKCFILNTDRDIEIADKYDISSVPVVLLFKNGEKRYSLVGTLHKENYVAAIEKLLVDLSLLGVDVDYCYYWRHCYHKINFRKRKRTGWDLLQQSDLIIWQIWIPYLLLLCARLDPTMPDKKQDDQESRIVSCRLIRRDLLFSGLFVSALHASLLSLSHSGSHTRSVNCEPEETSMAPSALPKLHLLLVWFFLIFLICGLSVRAQVEETSLQLMTEVLEWPLMERLYNEFGDEVEDGRIGRRSLFWRKVRYYISYGALSANRIPCPPRSGRSYYTHNCYKARGPVNPYSRGCSRITRCRS